MPYVNPIWLEGRRRYWQRHDAHRFRRPDGSEYKSYATRLIEQRQAEEEEARIAAEQEEMRETLSWLRRELAEVKFALAMRRIAHKYDPNQPRAPKGDPDGGQWTKEGGGDAGKDEGGDSLQSRDAELRVGPAVSGRRTLQRLRSTLRRCEHARRRPRAPARSEWRPTAASLRSATVRWRDPRARRRDSAKPTAHFIALSAPATMRVCTAQRVDAVRHLLGGRIIGYREPGVGRGYRTVPPSSRSCASNRWAAPTHRNRIRATDGRVVSNARMDRGLACD